MKNTHWLHQPKQEMYFQASYTGDVQPTIICSSNLPEYVTTTQSPTTTKKATTQPPTTSKKPSTQPQTTSKKPQTTTKPTGNGVPVIVLNDWPAGDGKRRMNGRCSFQVAERRAQGEILVNLTFVQGTFDYIVSSACFYIKVFSNWLELYRYIRQNK